MRSCLYLHKLLVLLPLSVGSVAAQANATTASESTVTGYDGPIAETATARPLPGNPH